MLLLCAGCSNTDIGSWSFLCENGNIIHGNWQHKDGKAVTQPWCNNHELSSATGHLVVKWSKHGSKYVEAFFVNGKPHGTWILWHNNKELKCVGKHSNGRKRDTWLWWDRDGLLISKIPYDKVPDGVIL